MKATGKALLEHFQVNSSSVKVVSDVVMRDSQTALGLLEGISQPGERAAALGRVVYDHVIFDTVNSDHGHPLCQSVDSALQAEELRALLTSTSAPMGVGLPNATDFRSKYTTVLADLQSLIGIGRAGPLTVLNSPPYVDDRAALTGSVRILKFFAEQLLYSFGSGIDYGKNASVQQIYDLAAWIYYERHVSSAPSQLATQGVAIVQSVLNDLTGAGAIPQGSTSIYFGHDTTLDEIRVFLNISWQAPPFKTIGGAAPTPPGSALVFTHWPGSSNVEVEFLYPAFNGSTSSPIQLSHAEPPIMSHEEVGSRIKQIVMRYPTACQCWQRAREYITR